ncbi:MAG: hypothetical protein KKA67_02745 [Spirochaetes bacterium]|nr:hypothetical protein [Spirochaetota bacterium]MBU1081183.1 hypothetical protein [Spirochaetota bacterium]
MKKIASLLLVALASVTAYGQSRVPAQGNTTRLSAAAEPATVQATPKTRPPSFFATISMPVSSLSGADFSGENFYGDGSFVIAVPSMPVGIGWGASVGFEFPLGADGAFSMREDFTIQQTFHAGEFLGSPMRSSSLLCVMHAGASYRAPRLASIYASVGWAIPYWIFIEDGFSDGSTTGNLSYLGIEGIEALAGAELRLTEDVSLFAEAIYRLLDFGNADFDDRALVPVEYFGAAGWNFRAGLRIAFPME